MKKPIPNIRNLSVSELLYILANDKNDELEYCDNDFITHIRLNTNNLDLFDMDVLLDKIWYCVLDQIISINGEPIYLHSLAKKIKEKDWDKKMYNSKSRILENNNFTNEMLEYLEKCWFSNGRIGDVFYIIDTIQYLEGFVVRKEYTSSLLSYIDVFETLYIYRYQKQKGISLSFIEIEEREDNCDFNYDYLHLPVPTSDKTITQQQYDFLAPEYKERETELLEILNKHSYNAENIKNEYIANKEIERLFGYLKDKGIIKSKTDKIGLILFCEMLNIGIKENYLDRLPRNLLKQLKRRDYIKKVSMSSLTSESNNIAELKESSLNIDIEKFMNK